MADIQFSHGMGGYGREADWDADEGDTHPRGHSLVSVANIAGAVMSLALVTGVGIWSYDLMVRDVSGIPVVRAASGEMRVRPENPGGLLAEHQGLAVNEIAANGAATGPVEQVTLAPPAVALAEDDQPVRAQPVIQPAPLAPATGLFESTGGTTANAGQALRGTEIDNLVASILAEDALSVVSAGEDGSAADPQEGIDTEPDPQIAQEAGNAPVVWQSARPKLRPADIQSLVRPASFTPVAESREIDPAAIPSGTRLAQLGAFESADVARAEWQRMQGLFGDILEGKSRVVQQVDSSGRIFYRLRAMGFVDLNDTRRFCSAVMAEGVDCIPVQVK